MDASVLERAKSYLLPQSLLAKMKARDGEGGWGNLGHVLGFQGFRVKSVPNVSCLFLPRTRK